MERRGESWAAASDDYRTWMWGLKQLKKRKTKRGRQPEIEPITWFSKATAAPATKPVLFLFFSSRAHSGHHARPSEFRAKITRKIKGNFLKMLSISTESLTKISGTEQFRSMRHDMLRQATAVKRKIFNNNARFICTFFPFFFMT